MPITLNIDIEAIVIQEIRKIVRDNVILNNTTEKSTIIVENNNETGQASILIEKDSIKIIDDYAITQADTTKIIHAGTLIHSNPELVCKVVEDTPEYNTSLPEYDYAPNKDKRRNKTQIALHKKELELCRKLTPEELGTFTAQIELDAQTTENAKQAAVSKQKAEDVVAKVRENSSEPTDSLFEQDHLTPAPEELQSTPKDDWSLPGGNLFDKAPISNEIEPDSIEDVLPESSIFPKEETIPKTEDIGNLDNLFE